MGDNIVKIVVGHDEEGPGRGHSWGRVESVDLISRC